MRDQKTQEFLFELLRTPSPTGFEMNGQRVWAKYMRAVADEVGCDAYGSTWAILRGESTRKNAEGPRVMLEAHADEIGYMIKCITREGYIYLERVGGSDAATARGKRLDLLGDKGVVRGLVGNVAIHIRENREDEKAPKIHELQVDVGASNDKEVAEMGLRIGHVAVYAEGPENLGKDRLVGRAIDNRIGGFILSQVMLRLKKSKKKPAATLIALNAVQEEIGGYGAKMATHRLRPDVAVCFDVTHATDTPGISKEKHGEVRLGDGPSITHGTSTHPKVVKRLMDVAKAKKINLQHESSSRFSGTDTDEIYHVGDGIPSGLISLPLRYMHSVIEMASYDDIEKCIDLLTGFVESIKPGETFHHEL